MKFDTTRVGLFTDIFSSIAEEMGSVLERVSFSPNIKERRDYSCAIFDPEGNLAAQASHIPVHLGAMEFLMKRWLASGPRMADGGFYITNDPYFAGTHLPDISVIAPVERDGIRIGYVATRAHHSDIGGVAPGSMAANRSIHEEGMIISPQELTLALANEIASTCRGKEERIADLEAQRAAASLGSIRVRALSSKYGAALKNHIQDCLAYAEEMTRASLSGLRPGSYKAEDHLEDVPGSVARIRVKIELDGSGQIRFDFSGSSEQVAIGVNATEAVTRSACYYVVRCLTPGAPTNGGCWKPIEVFAPPNSIVNAGYPAPVAAGNTETSQRIVDVILQALPGPMPACSQGTMNNVAFGTDRWAYYETIGGGAGAGPMRDGASGVHTHMTNTRNTPVEALELELPIRVLEYQLRTGSGGGGSHEGGEGVVRSFEALGAGITCSLMTDRRSCGPPGSEGGVPGSPGRNTFIRVDTETLMDSKAQIELQQGDIVRIETPGGGGWGLSDRQP